MASKKQSTKKLSFRKTSPLKMLLAVVVVFAVTGIGTYLLTRSNAATGSYPPVNLKLDKNLGSIKASDGITGQVFCVSVSGSNVYGPLAQCIQSNPNNNAPCGGVGDTNRVGFYNLLTKVFSATSGWLAVNNPCKGGYDSVNGFTPILCKNGPYYYVGVGGDWPLYNASVPTSYGQVYNYSNNKWQIKWSNMNLINGNCYPTGSWRNAKAW